MHASSSNDLPCYIVAFSTAANSIPGRDMGYSQVGHSLSVMLAIPRKMYPLTMDWTPALYISTDLHHISLTLQLSIFG